MFFNWISRCWSGMGVNTRFQKARVNCSIIDWTSPYQQDIYVLISSFQDKNPQIPSKTALNMFFTHLQSAQQRRHPAFILKQIFILDHSVQELTALDTIGYYYNSTISSTKSPPTLDIQHSPINDLISSYFSYVKIKAKHYSYYELKYFSKQLLLKNNQMMSLTLPDSKQKKIKNKKACTEQQQNIVDLFAQEQSFTKIFEVIEKCTQIQKAIDQMNKSYLKGNKKVGLIQAIFTLLLKTYIRCYVIISIGLKHLLKQFLKMSLSQLQQFIKLINFFNKQYTTNFITFIETNKNQIQIFKLINYNQLTYIKKQVMNIMVEYEKDLREITCSKRALAVSVLGHNEAYGVIQELPHEIHVMIKQNMKITYKPRLNFSIIYGQSTTHSKDFNSVSTNQNILKEDIQQISAEAFQNYQNMYHTQFILPDFDENINKQANSVSNNNSVTVIRTMQENQKKIQSEQLILTNKINFEQPQKIILPRKKIGDNEKSQQESKQEWQNKGNIQSIEQSSLKI